MTQAPNKQGESRVIAQIGAKPHQVTVTTRDIRGVRSVVVEWRELGKRRLWKATATVRRQAEAEAKAFAKAKHAILVERAKRVTDDEPQAPAPITWLQLVAAYQLAEGADWAPNTRRNFAARVKTFTLFFGGDTAATKATLETLDEFRAMLRTLGREPAEINRITTTIKAVFAFGLRRDLLVTKVPLYVAKKLRGAEANRIPEFSPSEVLTILGELKPRATIAQGAPHRPWRPWAITILAAQTGKRTKSQILPLRWDEITWTRGGATVHWVKERDKLRRKHVQPLPRRSAAVLRLVRWLLRREGYTGPLVFPAMETERVKTKGLPYSYTALHHHVAQACKRGSVTRKKGQALHAFRRYAANEVLDHFGGDLKKAGLWLNDVDLRVLSMSYVRERSGEQETIATAMRKPDRAPKAAQTSSASRPTAEQDSEPTANAPAQAEASREQTV